MKKFIEYIGNASTSASLDGRFIGSDVAAAAFYDNESETTVSVYLTNHGSRISSINPIDFENLEEYEDWVWDLKDSSARALFAAAIEKFGAEVWL